MEKLALTSTNVLDQTTVTRLKPPVPTPLEASSAHVRRVMLDLARLAHALMSTSAKPTMVVVTPTLIVSTPTDLSLAAAELATQETERPVQTSMNAIQQPMIVITRQFVPIPSVLILVLVKLDSQEAERLVQISTSVQPPMEVATSMLIV